MQAGSRLTAWAAPDQALSEVLFGKEASLNGLVHVNAKGLVAARDADASQHRKTDRKVRTRTVALVNGRCGRFVGAKATRGTSKRNLCPGSMHATRRATPTHHFHVRPHATRLLHASELPATA